MGDDGFEDFVADGGEDALVVVLAEVLSSQVSIPIPMYSVQHNFICMTIPDISWATCQPPVYAVL